MIENTLLKYAMVFIDDYYNNPSFITEESDSYKRSLYEKWRIIIKNQAVVCTLFIFISFYHVLGFGRWSIQVSIIFVYAGLFLFILSFALYIIVTYEFDHRKYE